MEKPGASGSLLDGNQQLADLLEFFEAMRGAFKVLNWLGKLAKPTAAIVGLGASVMAAYAAWRGVR